MNNIFRKREKLQCNGFIAENKWVLFLSSTRCTKTQPYHIKAGKFVNSKKTLQKFIKTHKRLFKEIKTEIRKITTTMTYWNLPRRSLAII